MQVPCDRVWNGSRYARLVPTDRRTQLAIRPFVIGNDGQAERADRCIEAGVVTFVQLDNVLFDELDIAPSLRFDEALGLLEHGEKSRPTILPVGPTFF